MLFDFTHFSKICSEIFPCSCQQSILDSGARDNRGMSLNLIDDLGWSLYGGVLEPLDTNLFSF